METLGATFRILNLVGGMSIIIVLAVLHKQGRNNSSSFPLLFMWLTHATVFYLFASMWTLGYLEIDPKFLGLWRSVIHFQAVFSLGLQIGFMIWDEYGSKKKSKPSLGEGA